MPILCSLAACANHGPDRVVTQAVLTPMPVSCVPEGMPGRPANPATPEALKAARDAAERYALLAQAWTIMGVYDGMEDAVLDACRKAGPAH